MMNIKLKAGKDQLISSQNLYQASVDHNLTQIQSKMNEIMNFFSAIATIFLPLNLFGSL